MFAITYLSFDLYYSMQFPSAVELGATDVVDSSKLDKPVQAHIVEMTTWGVDYTFDCTGNVSVMRAALECAHRGEFPLRPLLGLEECFRSPRGFLFRLGHILCYRCSCVRA
jgi:hypothetical protein